MKIENFVRLMTGRFDNKEQFTEMKKAGKMFPYAQHVNTVCNDKIKNMPEDFTGIFIVEESYYETDGKCHASPHLFLITENKDGIMLSSYEIPVGEDKTKFSYDSMKPVDYGELKKSVKFISGKGRLLGRGKCEPFYAGYDIPVMGEVFR